MGEVIETEYLLEEEKTTSLWAIRKFRNRRFSWDKSPAPCLTLPHRPGVLPHTRSQCPGYLRQNHRQIPEEISPTRRRRNGNNQYPYLRKLTQMLMVQNNQEWTLARHTNGQGGQHKKLRLCISAKRHPPHACSILPIVKAFIAFRQNSYLEKAQQ